MSKEAMDDSLNIRISSDEKAQFVALCDAYGVQSYTMLREIITAFNAGNLRIVVPENHLRIYKGVHTHVA